MYIQCYVFIIITMIFRFLSCCFLSLFSTLATAQEHNIVSYGAIADGTTLNTIAIQHAIDKAHAQGGGRVVIPKGRFLSGSIVLKSGVELHLEKNAVLLGSSNPDDYIRIRRWKALVMADSAHNIAISGKGVIDGQGAELALHMDSLFYSGILDSNMYNFVEKRVKAHFRPQIVEVVLCDSISVTGITLRNAASWVQSYDRSSNLYINHIRVESDAYWNNDGLDIIDCRNVMVTDCYINSSDDGICLKSYDRTKQHFCQNISISNCTVRSSASAVKFGTASYSGFRDIKVKGIKVFDTFRSAIALECIHGGFLENVLVEDIKATNTGNAIFLRIGHNPRAEEPGTLKDVTIRNVEVEVPFERMDYSYKIRGPKLPFFHNVFPSSITGIPGHPVQNVTLENIQITYPGRGNKAYAHMPTWRLDAVPEAKEDYPEFSMFGELPAWGLYVRHVEGLTMKNVQLMIKEADYRPAIVLDDVKGASFQALSIKGDEKSSDPIYAHQSEDITIKE